MRRSRSVRGRRFRKLIAETGAAIEQGDVDRARELLRRCPPGRERVAASLLFDYSSPLGSKESPDLLFTLYEQARSGALSLIGDYAQPPEVLEHVGRHV